MVAEARMERAVQDRYAAGADVAEAALCCPVDYDPQYLAVLPQEIIDKDYGCGDPSRYLRPGETVLDLGCGTGKICYIAAQVVGLTGRVIGVDMTPEMLAVAQKYQTQIGERLGFHNVEFRHGRIQDLRTNFTAVEQYLHRHPVASVADLQAFEAFQAEQRGQQPLVVDESIDVVVSNCVLNLVQDERNTDSLRRSSGFCAKAVVPSSRTSSQMSLFLHILRTTPNSGVDASLGRCRTTSFSGPLPRQDSTASNSSNATNNRGARWKASSSAL
jgi:SAM-dependent methyltransferase